MNHPQTVAGRLDLLMELMKKSEPCICEKCGTTHMTPPGPLADKTPEEIRAILESPSDPLFVETDEPKL